MALASREEWIKWHFLVSSRARRATGSSVINCQDLGHTIALLWVERNANGSGFTRLHIESASKK